jgi:acylphosphatase
MADQPNIQARTFHISGRVQGVFFRRSAQLEAQRLGLCGWVRNLDDGRVEAYACGSPDVLDEFARWLKRGPPHARVNEVLVNAAPVAVHAGFTVR